MLAPRVNPGQRAVPPDAGSLGPVMAGDLPDGTLLATKLYAPRPIRALVTRPRLLELVQGGLRGPLTLLAAPAGWGKTTLLAEWRAGAVGNAIALAWLSLDARDDDPARFWDYAAAALQTAHPGLGEIARALLRSPRPPAIEAIVTSLLNELAAVPGETALVLDDFHAIESPAIHESLAFFLDHLTPRAHLVISTRADPPLPLARLRARGAMVEIRADDLRFAPGEARALVSGVLALPIDAGTIAALEARTEGWAAGLQLAALAMRGRPDVAGFVGAFRGSHRFVADYLAEEVLDRQPGETQDFLLRTAVLDRMCAPLCAALAGDATPGGEREAQRMLERLERGNLFVIPLDGERRWYRYHHLFADLLRARQALERPGEAPLLHRRASAWLEREGLLEEAVHHALEAGDVGRAADLLEPVADQLWMGGQMAALRGWLARLPADALRARPRLLIAQARALFFLESHQIRAIEAILREAEAALRAGDPASPGVADAAAELDGLTGRIVAMRASQASWEPDTGRTIALARQALDRLERDDTMWRVVALEALGMAYALRGEMGAAARALADATAVPPSAGAGYVAIGARMWLAIVRVAQGKLRQARELYRRGLDQVVRQGTERLPVAGNYFVGLGVWVDYERDDLEAAERHLEQGIRHAGRQQWPWVHVDAYATLARIKLARGEDDAARDLVRRMERHARDVEIPWPWMAPRLAASMARAFLAFGDVARAAAWAAGLDASDAEGLDYIVEFQRITAARLLMATGRPAPALAELDRWLPRAEAHGRWNRVIEIEALRAVALEGLGNREEALSALGRALALAEPEGYVRRFVDEGPAMKTLLARAYTRGIVPAYAATLLRAFGEAVKRVQGASDQPPSADPLAARGADGLVEPLSDRERDVLRLLVAGRSGPEIADALVVAPSTVKTHLKHIYDKLGAHSRDQAIARVRELGLH